MGKEEDRRGIFGAAWVVAVQPWDIYYYLYYG